MPALDFGWRWRWKLASSQGHAIEMHKMPFKKELIACTSIMEMMMMNKIPKLVGTKFRKTTLSLLNGSSIDNFDKKVVYIWQYRPFNKL
jgi:hypothetical protein